MSSQKDLVRSRIDPALKAQAQGVLNAMGLSMSDALRLFLHQVVAEKRLPFEVKVPRIETMDALEASENGDVEAVTLEMLSTRWNHAKKH